MCLPILKSIREIIKGNGLLEYELKISKVLLTLVNYYYEKKSQAQNLIIVLVICINLRLVQNFIQILFTDTSKT